MNQDFALLATPANARRLMLFSRISKMNVGDDIAQLATRDTISDADFDPLVCPHSPVKQTISQFLLDCNLRGVVQSTYHPEFNALALLYTVKLAQPSRIVILSNRPARWEALITTLSLRTITTVLPYQALSKLDMRQTAVVIVDADASTFRSKVQILAREFSQIIVYEYSSDRMLETHWAIWAHLLFPTMPHPLYARMVKDVPEHYTTQPLSSLAVFYNTCIFPELINDPDLIAYMGDEHAVRRLTYHRGRLIS